MGINKVSSVTDTVTGEGSDVSGFIFGLDKLNEAILGLQSAGFMNKAEKAELAVLAMRHTMFAMASEVVALRAELERVKKHGFGG